jgi:multidrug efflux system membrane fusion protein
VVVHTIGTVLANSVVTVKPQVDGPLVSAMFQEGQMVKKGDLLFRIDPAPFEAALRQAQGTAERDRAQLASAQADAERAVMLSDRGIVSTQQRDQLVATAKALQATLAADEAAVDRAKLNLGYTTIRSPIDGKTGPFIVYPGNQVHAADAAGLVTITQIQPVKITFNLPQGNLPQLQDRMEEKQLVASVTARSDIAVADTTVSGDKRDMDIPVKVDFIGNTVDARTGTIELRATFDNPDQRLVPGELVDVSVKLETLKQATVVPREAVNVGQAGEYVFIIDGAKKAQMRQVKVLFQDQMIAALGPGIESGETVVIDGQLRLSPGVGVSIVGEPNSNPRARGAQATNPAAENPQGTRSKKASEGAPG